MLLIMKYIPGLHLRVDNEIEMIGYDVDQFHDETVGEWALFEAEGTTHVGEVTHGVVVDHGALNAPSSSQSIDAPPEKV